MILDAGAISAERADRPLVLALDIGTSSVRAALYDRSGSALRGCAVQVPYAWDLAPVGMARLSHRFLLDLVGRALDEITTLVGTLARDVVAAGISCFYHSVMGLDASRRPVTAVLSWADTTSAGEATALRERVDPQGVLDTTGAPIHASYWPARILRLRQEEPRVNHWAGFPELLLDSLTGRAAVSRSMSSGTGLLDRATGSWSASVLAQVGIDDAGLPPIVGDDEPVGRLIGPAARRWPGLAHVSWFAAWGDGACGNVGLGAIGPGRAALMVGTSGALRSVVADPAPAIPAGLFAYRLGAGAVVGGQLSEGGNLLAWVSRVLRRSPASLERAAAELAPDTHGLTILPYTFGERGLGYHDDARGSVIGLTPETEPGAIYRAIVESISFSFAAVDERLSAVLRGAPAIVASGGAVARSPLLAHALADSLGRDISVAPSVESSRRGAALLTLHASGHLDALSEVPAPRMRTIASDPARTARYRAARERRDDLYGALIA